MTKLIQKLGTAKFKVTTPNVIGQDLELDFNPLIKEFNLSGDFSLIHWQARPKGYREWGVYSSTTDSYQSSTKLKVNLFTCETLQLDDTAAKTIPSAVFICRNAAVNYINQKLIIGEVYLSDLAA